MAKRRIYLAQVNNTYGRNAFLPYSVGLLQAYAQQDPTVREHYDFAGYMYVRQSVSDVVAQMGPPDVFGASCYVWNFEFTMALIRAIRDRFPACLIVLGGPHVPVRSADFFRSHSAADLLVHYEGEVTFHEILLERLNPVPDYTRIAGLSVKLPTGETHKTPNRDRISDLSVIPSPYLTGVFDDLMSGPYDFHGSQETNRGCPYSCTFCDWGSNVMAQVKMFPFDRLVAEFEWFARHKVDLLYNCDANYGIFPRDLDLTREMVAVKARTGFPNKFRAAYAKNSNEAVFAIARTLHAAGMNKGVTLSFQSMNEPTLKLVKRHNIKIDRFGDLSRRYRAEGIATYSEFIIGLPGETYQTFADGLEAVIRAGQHDALQVYTCEVLPNSAMSNPEYLAQHRIETIRTPALFFHGTPAEDPHQEYYELVVGHATLTREDWLRCQFFSWAVQTFHCLSLTQAVALFLCAKCGIGYRAFYEHLLEMAAVGPHTVAGRARARAAECFANLQAGREWGVVDRRFGNIVWPIEEAAFLDIVTDKERFYQELFDWVIDLCEAEETCRAALEDVIRYQEAVVWAPAQDATVLRLGHNVHEFLEAAYFGRDVRLIEESCTYHIQAAKQYDDLETYAREVVWYGRKGGRFRHTDIDREREEVALHGSYLAT